MDSLSMEFALESEKILSGGGLPLETMSPLAFHWAFATAVHLTRMGSETPGKEVHSALETVLDAFQIGNLRWKLAGIMELFYYCPPV
jgi:hypothetical protein